MKTIVHPLSVVALALPTLSAIAAPTTYTIDPNHAAVTSESRHFGTSTTRTRFPVKGGTVTIDPAAKSGTATVTIDVAGLATGLTKLDDHLKRADFFDVPTYPEATFTASKFTFDGDKVVSIAGDLTMHGKTNPITLTSTNYNCYMSPGLKKQVCGGDFETTIQRSAWDMKFLIPFVSDETKLLVQIEASKD